MRVRLVKAVDPSCRGLGSKQPVLYTLSKRKLQALTQTHSGCNKMNYLPECPCVVVTQGHEEHLIPYSVVQPVHIQTKRPVIFSPSILSHGLIERLMQPAESRLMFDTCSAGMWTSIMLFFATGRPKYSRTIEFFLLAAIWHTSICSMWFAEPILASERQDKTVFLLDSCSPDHTQGIRLQSLQEVINQVIKINHLSISSSRMA